MAKTPETDIVFGPQPQFEMPTHTGGDGWTILHGDCLRLMRQMQDGVFDAVITDPPGRAAAAALARLYGERYRVSLRLPPIENFDYGDLAQAALEYRTKTKAKNCTRKQRQRSGMTR